MCEACNWSVCNLELINVYLYRKIDYLTLQITLTSFTRMDFSGNAHAIPLTIRRIIGRFRWIVDLWSIDHASKELQNI